MKNIIVTGIYIIILVVNIVNYSQPELLCENIKLVRDFKNPLYVEEHQRINQGNDTLSSVSYTYSEFLYRAYYLDDLFTGTCVNYGEDSTVLRSKIYYKDGLKSKTIQYYPNGNINEIIAIKFGLPHGEYFKYDENEQLEVDGFYIQGKESGRWKFYKGGNINITGRFKDSKKHSNWIYYNDKAQPYLLEQYEYGKLKHKRSIERGKVKDFIDP